jgi:hypothetical protein
MNPLTLDDLLTLEEYASQRGEFFDSHQRYVDRYRRVQIGPRSTLVFENRQTLWFRIHEVLRVARLAEPEMLQEELEVYNRLLPNQGCLQAALLIAVQDETRINKELAPWQAMRGDELALHLGPCRYPANLYTSRPEDRCIGAAHWVQFVLDDGGREYLRDPKQPTVIRITLPSYQYESAPLSNDVRWSLLEDLTGPMTR